MRLTNFEKAQREIRKILDEQAKALIKRKRPAVRAAVKPMIIDAIYNSPEMNSVRVGLLKYDFGLTSDPTQIISWSVADSMRLRYFRGPEFSNGFSIEVQPSKHENLYGLPAAYQDTEKNVELPWLKWLLEMGDSIIIADFGVKYLDGGRSGGAIMLGHKSPFRVEPAYSGTESDNFITRALNKKLTEIQNVAWQIIKS